MARRPPEIPYGLGGRRAERGAASGNKTNDAQSFPPPPAATARRLSEIATR